MLPLAIMRIGIYSGTFDPVHEGHILFAQVACEQFGLDTVLFLPESAPRHKDSAKDVKHRGNMLELATADAEFETAVFVLETVPRHTVGGVLRAVAELYPEDEYYLLMGQDVFEHVGGWGAQPEDEGDVSLIADSVGFIVAIQGIDHEAELRRIADSLKLNARFIEPPLFSLSSRKIRDKLHRRESPVAGLNDNVARYIEQEKLYRD